MDILNDDGQRDNEGMDLLKQGYAMIDEDQGIVTPEIHAKQIQENNAKLVESGDADSYTTLSYGYGKINDERTNPGETFRRRGALKDANAKKDQAEYEKHKERFPEAFSK